jgi:hypothetical protein
VKSSDNGQKSTQRTLVKMTVTTVQWSTGQNDGDNSAAYTGHNPGGNDAAYSRAHTRPNNSRHNMSDNASAPGLNNGKQQTDLGKLDAVDGNSVVTPRKQGDTTNRRVTAYNVVRTRRG